MGSLLGEAGVVRPGRNARLAAPAQGQEIRLVALHRDQGAGVIVMPLRRAQAGMTKPNFADIFI